MLYAINNKLLMEGGYMLCLVCWAKRPSTVKELGTISELDDLIYPIERKSIVYLTWLCRLKSPGSPHQENIISSNKKR